VPQLLILSLLGAGLWTGYRWYRRQVKEVAGELRAAEEALRKQDENAIPSLKEDPETGVYHPAQNGRVR
jgi:hypothetical protein